MTAPAVISLGFENDRLRVVPGLLVIAAVLFNPALAIINAHVTPLSSAAVVGSEMALVCAAQIIALANYRPAMMTWYALLVILLSFAIYRSFALEQLSAKYLRDVLLIPTFITLGMTFDDEKLTRVILTIHVVVVAVLVLEAVDTPAYSALFHVQDYYINTRDYAVGDFWNKQSDLYVSATRPDERLFSFIALHRLSSIFLEPVSLGDYCIIIVAFVATRWRRLSLPALTFVVGGTVFALVGSDGRLAAAASCAIVVAAIATSYLPRLFPLLALPCVLTAALLLVQLGDLHDYADNFSGRIAHTVELLRQFGAAEFFGVSSNEELLSMAVDSGISYLIITQSVMAVVILWMFIALGSRRNSLDQARFTDATAIYLSLTMMVSFSFLTIKTASLLWFIHGSLQAARGSSEVEPGWFARQLPARSGA